MLCTQPQTIEGQLQVPDLADEPGPIGPVQSGVTSWCSNFVELFFCQLRCNARYDRPHKYPLVVNIWARSGSPWRAFRHLAPGYPQVGCLCSFLDGSNVARDGVATCSCLYWGVQSYLYANNGLGFFVG